MAKKQAVKLPPDRHVAQGVGVRTGVPPGKRHADHKRAALEFRAQALTKRSGHEQQ